MKIIFPHKVSTLKNQDKPLQKFLAPEEFDCFEKQGIQQIEKIYSNYEPVSKPTNKNLSVWEHLQSSPIEKFKDLYIRLFPNYEEVFKDALQKLPKKSIKETFTELEKLEKEFPEFASKTASNFTKYKSYELTAQNIMQMLILKANQPQTYKYLINTPEKNLVSLFLNYSDNNLSGNVFQTLTKEQINIIKDKFNINNHSYFDVSFPKLNAYINCSDNLTPLQIKETSEYLSQFKFFEDVTAFRGERDPGMFASVNLSKDMGTRIKHLVLMNFAKAKNTHITEMNGTYQKTYTKQTNLFDYITGKKELTLADAMHVMKFGDEKFQNEIIELIKQSSIKDLRFKSYTFDKKMAKDWLKSPQFIFYNSEDVTILQNTIVKKGVEGHYADSLLAEIILNNKPKTITFQNVEYNPKDDMFILDSTISQD